MGTMGPGMWSPPSERGMAAVMEVENALCYSQRGLSMSINCSCLLHPSGVGALEGEEATPSSRVAVSSHPNIPIPCRASNSAADIACL